jgi:fucose 4-O-acetylase-like acetyltransferase
MSATTSETGLAIGPAGRVDGVIQRDLAIDSIRGVAILMVVGIHSLPQPLDANLAKAIDALLRPAVPLFLFVSGYLSGRMQRVPALKRIKSALIPYTIAFVAAYGYMALDNPAMDHRPWTAAARYGLGYVFVYYYVPVYIGCTILLWLLLLTASRLSADRMESGVAVVLAIAILFGLVAGSYLDPLLARLSLSGELIEEARLRNIPFWFAFMALGSLIAVTRFENPLRETAPLLIGCTALGYAIYVSVRISTLGDAAAYDSIAFFAYAAPLCATLLIVPPRSHLLAYVGSGSYFVYLWHIFIVMLLRDHGNPQHPAIASILTYATTVGVSLLALFAIRSTLPPRPARWLGA